MGKEKKTKGGGGKIVILSTTTSTQIPNHETNKKKQATQLTYVKILDGGSWEKLQNVYEPGFQNSR